MRVLWFVLLLPLVALSNPVPNSCIDKNPFLASMKNAKPLSVGLYTTPKFKEFKYCEDEWNRFGSCCHNIDLVDFFTLESRLLHVNRKYLTKAVGAIATISGDQQTFLDFDSHSRQCWHYMKKVRGSALCSTCSGRSQEFFDGDRILISPRTCEKALPMCEDFFLLISKVSKIIPGILSDRKSRKMRKAKYHKLKSLHDDLEKYKPPTKLIQAFEEYRNAILFRRPILLASIKVCSMIMNIHKQPYLLNLNHEGLITVTYSLLLKQLKKMKRSIQKLRREILELTANLKTSDESQAETIQKEIDRKQKHRARVRELLPPLEEQIKKYEPLIDHSVLEDEEEEPSEIPARASIAGQRLTSEAVRSIISKQESRSLQSKADQEGFSKAGQETPGKPMTSDSSVLIPQDSMWTSFNGIPGSTLENENSNMKAANMSLKFP